MKFVVVNVIHQQGIGAKSGKPYDFNVVEGLIQTAKGKAMCKLMLDKDHPPVVEGKTYMIEIELYPDRESKLTMRVAGLRAIEAAKAA